MASSVDAAQKAILARIQSQLASAIGVTLAGIQYPNTAYTPPAIDATPAQWAKVDLLWGDAFPATMAAVGSGAARNTIAGLLQITVLGPLGVGEGDLNALANKFRDAFNRQDFSGVRCGVVSGPSPSPDPEGAWRQRMLRVPFTVDELQ